MSPSPLCDLLTCLAISQDQAAWSAVVELAGPDVVRVCRRIAGPGPMAEDACQEAWMRIRSDVRSFTPSGSDPESGARAWVRRLAATTTLKLLRSQHRLTGREHRAEPPAGAPDPLTVILQHELAEQVRASLAGLPERERTALTLRHFGDLDLAAIASEMDCPVGSVKSLVSRGLARLRGRLLSRGIAVGTLALAGFLERIDAAEGPHAHLPADSTVAVKASAISMKGIVIMSSLSVSLLATVLLVTGHPVAGAAVASDAPMAAIQDPAMMPLASIDPASARLAWSDSGLSAPFIGIAPVPAGDLILAAGQDAVRAYDAAGRRRWEVRVAGYHHRPAVSADAAFIADTRRLLAVNLADGMVRWEVDLGGKANNQSSPLLVGDLVILPSRDGRIRALRAGDGSPVWVWGGDGAGTFDAAIVNGDQVLVVDWQKGIQAHALSDGNLRWRRELVGAGHNLSLHEGSIFMGYHDFTRGLGGVCRLNAKDGSTIWIMDNPDRDFIGTPAISRGMVVSTCKDAIVGLSLADGQERWRVPRKHFGYEDPVIDQAGRILLGDDESIIRIIDPADGRALCELPLMPLAQHADAPVLRHRDQAGTERDTLGCCTAPLPVDGGLYVTTASGWSAAIILPGISPPVGAATGASPAGPRPIAAEPAHSGF